jgi:DNA-directed RNA polymerase beta subunit
MPSHINGDGAVTTLTPMLCRLRNISYLTTLTASLHLTRLLEHQGKVHLIDSQVFDKFEVCRLPVMVGSRLCYTYRTVP